MTLTATRDHQRLRIDRILARVKVRLARLFDHLRIRRHLAVGGQACVRRRPIPLRICLRRLVRALMGHAKRGIPQARAGYCVWPTRKDKELVQQKS